MISNPIPLPNTMDSVGVITNTIEGTPQDLAEVTTHERRPQRASCLPQRFSNFVVMCRGPNTNDNSFVRT